MLLRLASCFIFLVLILSSDAKRGSSRGGSWGSSFKTSRPKSSSSSGHSNSGTARAPAPGWNVGQSSAPITKTNAGHVQSGYQPSGGYNRGGTSGTGGAFGQGSATHSNPSQSNHGYNPPVQSHVPSGQTYHPSSQNNPPPAYHPPGQNYPGYHPPGQSYPGQTYHPPGQSYPGQSYHPPGQSYPGQYHPSGGYGGYNSPGSHGPPPPYSPGHSYQHGASYNPPVAQAPPTIVVAGGTQSYKGPGVGQIAKEAIVHAGVNAAVNRLIPGGIYGTWGSPWGGSPGHSSSSSNSQPGQPQVVHTENVYNYYGGAAPNNASNPAPNTPGQAAPNPPAAGAPNPNPPAAGAAPAPDAPAQNTQNTQNTATAAPATQQNAPPPNNVEFTFGSPSGRNITLTEFQRLTEDLLAKDVNNAGKFVSIKLQGQKMDDSVNDDAPELLLTVKDEAWSIPTVKAVLDLHDNYDMDVHVKEVTTDDKEREENAFLDLILQTEVMKETMKFLVNTGYIKDDQAEFKRALKDIWFWQFKRTDGDAGSSGFESVFLAEKFDSEIIGLHNWIYYAKMEANGKLNYLGYIRNAMLGEKGAVTKVRSSLNGIVQPVTSIFVGTSPELEVALYTLCFYTLPNYPCPVKLAGNEIAVMVNAYTYFSKLIMVSAYPDL